MTASPGQQQPDGKATSKPVDADRCLNWKHASALRVAKASRMNESRYRRAFVSIDQGFSREAARRIVPKAASGWV